MLGSTTVASITAVGALVNKSGIDMTTLRVSAQHAGDLLVLAVKVSSPIVTASSVSGGGVTRWTRVEGPYAGYGGYDLEIWTGVVSATGASTITVSFLGQLHLVYTGFAAQEFSSSAGTSTTWGTETRGGISNVSSTTITFPKLTPGGLGELYFGYDADANTGSGGTTSGFSYGITADADVVTYDTSVMGAVQPTAKQSPVGLSGAVALLITASGPAIDHLSDDHRRGQPGRQERDQHQDPVGVPAARRGLACPGRQGQLTDSHGLVGLRRWGDLVDPGRRPVCRLRRLRPRDLDRCRERHGSSTITVSFSGAVTSVYTGLVSHEFSASSRSSTVWGTDTRAGIASASSTAVTFPKLAPTGSGELYFGYAAVANTGSAGTTSGFSYGVTSDADVVAYDTSVSGAVQPAAKQSPAGVSGGVAALITASP